MKAIIFDSFEELNNFLNDCKPDKIFTITEGKWDYTVILR